MALDVTVGGANAVSYATVAEFKTYRDFRLPIVASVSLADDSQIEAALVAACRFLDNDFMWSGSAVDAVQRLTWPRNAMFTRNGFAIPPTVIPRELKDAQCEIAYELLAGVDLVADNDARKQGIASVNVAGAVAVSFQSLDLSTKEGMDLAIRRLASEFNYVSDQITSEVRRILVPSWFDQPSIVRPLLFRAVG